MTLRTISMGWIPDLSNDISVINVGDLTVTRSIPVGQQPWGVVVNPTSKPRQENQDHRKLQDFRQAVAVPALYWRISDWIPLLPYATTLA